MAPVRLAIAGTLLLVAACVPVYLPARDVTVIVPRAEPMPDGRPPAALAGVCRRMAAATAFRRQGERWFCFMPPTGSVQSARSWRPAPSGNWARCMPEDASARMSMRFVVLAVGGDFGGLTGTLGMPSGREMTAPVAIHDQVGQFLPDGELLVPPSPDPAERAIRMLVFRFDSPCEEPGVYRLALKDRDGGVAAVAEFESVTWTSQGQWRFIGE